MLVHGGRDLRAVAQIRLDTEFIRDDAD